MIISSHLGFILVHVPKTAGDAIVHAIKPHLKRNDVLFENDFQGWRRRMLTSGDPDAYALGKHPTAREMKVVMAPADWDACFKVGFVRHPFMRAYSLYTYLARMAADRKRARPKNLWYLTPPGRGGGDPLLWPAMRAYLDSASFSEFIRNPMTLEDLAMKSQVEYLCDSDGNREVDFVGAYENLNADIQKVAEHLRLGPLGLSRRNASGAAPATPELSADDRRYLGTLFAADLDEFGYTHSDSYTVPTTIRRQA